MLFRSGFYLGFKLAMNAAGVLLITGAALALWRRLVIKPPTQESSADDLLLPAWLALLAVQGFALQALRLHLLLAHRLQRLRHRGGEAALGIDPDAPFGLSKVTETH